MPSDTVVVSAKVPKALRDRLDEIVEELEFSNRSILVRRALISFVERHVSVGIPHAESDIEGSIGRGETLDTSQEKAFSGEDKKDSKEEGS